jgi:UDP-N-acetylmuramoylalanine--D-glutamate ligase
MYSTIGLEHRMELFHTWGGVEFINDSKGTNIDATLKALEGDEPNLILICGGKDKKLDLSPLAKLIASKTKKLFLIGETSDKLEKMVKDYGYDENEIYNLKEIAVVVKKLKEILKDSDSVKVLFSPAASSFDQFNSFEERGKIFKELVKSWF